MGNGLSNFEFGGASPMKSRRGGSNQKNKPVKATAEAAQGTSAFNSQNLSAVQPKGTRFENKQK